MPELVPTPARGSDVPQTTEQLIYELQIHQIELEFQNEDLRRSLDALDALKARYFALYDLAPVGYATLSEDGLIQELNLALLSLLNARRDSLIGRPLTDVILAEDKEIFHYCRRRLWSTREPRTCELRMKSQDGAVRWIHLETSLTATDESGAPGWHVILSDITERKGLDQARRDHQELFELFMRHSPMCACIKEVTSTASRILHASDSCRHIMGNSAENLEGKLISDLFPGAYGAKITADDWAVVSTGKALTLEEHWNGRHYSKIKFPITQGAKTYLASYAVDITEKVRVDELLHQSANNDPLTGVFNRAHFLEVAVDELKRAIRLQRSLTIVLIYLDGLKRRNDSEGRKAGDQALLTVARLCQDNLREIDVFARFSGDTFVWLLPEATDQQAHDCVERIRQALTERPMDPGALPAWIGIHVGIATLGTQPESLERLLERAAADLHHKSGDIRERPDP